MIVTDLAATQPALAIVPVLTPVAPAAPAPATPLAPPTPQPQPEQQQRMGERAPRRQALTRRLAPPAPVTTPLGITTPTQDAGWRAQAMQLAWEYGAHCAATWLGVGARGAYCYRVPATVSAAHAPRRYYRVSFIPDAHAQTIDDGRWLCECLDGRCGYPCHHVGAAYLLANSRALVRESMALAAAARMNWAHATLSTNAPDAQVAIYSVGHAAASRWTRMRVCWDRAHQVALWCSCGARACPHIGAVALRVEMERVDHLRRCQHGWN